MFLIKINILLVLTSVLAEEGREQQGYPRGLVSYCPGSTKPVKIARSQLKHLQFIVVGNGSKRRYTYWNAKKIVADPRINLKRKTMIFASGYLDSANFPISKAFANEYSLRKYNVILLDYQWFATVHYFLAARLLSTVGFHFAEIIQELTALGLNRSTTELLGFSLGGQMVGKIGNNYQHLTGHNLSRITSLEPAGPCFRTRNPKDLLNPGSADFVQVVHTNIDGFGMASQMGQVDFYVNGGEFQPSDLNLYPCADLCSHFRVLALWIAAMKNPESFVAIKCDSVQQARDALCYNKEEVITNLMGLRVDPRNEGIFYLATSLGYPYYLGAEGLKERNAFWNIVSDINRGNKSDIFT